MPGLLDMNTTWQLSVLERWSPFQIPCCVLRGDVVVIWCDLVNDYYTVIWQYDDQCALRLRHSPLQFGPLEEEAGNITVTECQCPVKTVNVKSRNRASENQQASRLIALCAGRQRRPRAAQLVFPLLLDSILLSLLICRELLRDVNPSHPAITSPYNFLRPHIPQCSPPRESRPRCHHPRRMVIPTPTHHFHSTA